MKPQLSLTREFKMNDEYDFTSALKRSGLVFLGAKTNTVFGHHTHGENYLIQNKRNTERWNRIC